MTANDAAATMKANLKEKTGRSLAQWVKIARSSKETKHGKVVQFLKQEHELTHGYANMVAHEMLQSSAVQADAGDLVETQYAGKKAELRPIYDALMKAVQAFGNDVEVAPKKAYVSLRRSKQFALIQPSTATRVDVGLCLKGVEPTDRLEASGSFNSMCSHRVRLSTPKDVNAELKRWLKQAYAAS